MGLREGCLEKVNSSSTSLHFFCILAPIAFACHCERLPPASGKGVNKFTKACFLLSSLAVYVRGRSRLLFLSSFFCYSALGSEKANLLALCVKQSFSSAHLLLRVFACRLHFLVLKKRIFYRVVFLFILPLCTASRM